MSKYDKLKKQKEFAFNQAHEETANLFTVAAESRRVANVAHNAGEIITDLDRKFSSATKLNGKDIAFLFFATALQCIRWILMPERGASQRSIEREQRPEHKLRLDIIENNEPPASPEPTGDSPTWQNLLLSPAPYLADLSGVEPPKNKLASLLPPKDEDRDIADAWGTDPIFGWIFGTLNILSSTVTTRDMRTFAVSQDNVDALPLFLLTPDALTVEPDTTISLPGLFKTCYELFQSDPKLLLAAIAKQASQALDTSAFGFTIPPICGLTTEELTEKTQTAYMQARDIKSRFEQIASAGNADFSATIQRDLSGAFDMLDEVRSMGYFIEETIDEVQGKLDEEDVAPEVQELFENAQASIGKITDILSKPQELLAASGAPIQEYADVVMQAIMASKDAVNEARDKLNEAGAIIGLDSPMHDLFDKADNMLGGAADFTCSVQDMFSSPQQFIQNIQRQIDKLNNKSDSMAATKDLGIIGMQAAISILINYVVKTLHQFCYDERNDGDANLYEVRTRKILSYSNAIASGSNVLYVAISKNVKRLDIGGFAVTIYRLLTDYKFIQSIKQEFLSKQWYDIVMGDDAIYDFLDDNLK